VNTLPDNLRRLLGLHAIPARGFAPLVSISSQTISELLSGRRSASIHTARALADFFEVSLDGLLDKPFEELLITELTDRARFLSVEAKIPEEARWRSANAH
jgi:transcriptional regulator with XRE-family HTH domain